MKYSWPAGTLYKNSLYLFCGLLISNLSIFIVNVLLARGLSKSDYGVFTAVQSLSTLFLLLSNLGLPEATTQRIAERLGRGDRPGAAAAVAGAVKAMALSGIILLGVQFLAATPLSGSYAMPGMDLLLKMTATWTIPYFLISMGAAVIEGTQKMQYTLWMKNLFEPLKLSTVAVLAAFSAVELKNLFISWTAAYWAAAAVALIVLKIFLGKEGMEIPWRNSGRISSVYGASLPFYISFISPAMIVSLLPALVGKMSGSEETAILGAVMPFASGGALLFAPLAGALLPSVSGADEGSGQGVKPVHRTLFKWTGLIHVLLCGLMGAAGKGLIVLFYGKDYEPSYPILMALMFGAYFDGYRFVVDPLLKGSGNAKIVALVDLGRVLSLAVAVSWTATAHGALGAGLSLCGINAVGMAVKIAIARRRVGLRVWWIFLALSAANLTVSGCLFWFFGNYLF